MELLRDFHNGSREIFVLEEREYSIREINHTRQIPGGYKHKNTHTELRKRQSIARTENIRIIGVKRKNDTQATQKDVARKPEKEKPGCRMTDSRKGTNEMLKERASHQ